MWKRAWAARRSGRWATSGAKARKLSVMQNINQNGAFNAQYPNYGSIIQLNSIGNSNYNSLQTTLRMQQLARLYCPDSRSPGRMRWTM